MRDKYIKERSIFIDTKIPHYEELSHQYYC
jgi:hypothetical protein